MGHQGRPKLRSGDINYVRRTANAELALADMKRQETSGSFDAILFVAVLALNTVMYEPCILPNIFHISRST